MSTPLSNNPIILIADDDIDDQSMLSESLHEMYRNCVVELVSNGRLAITRLENSSMPKPSLIVLDLNMPVMGGLETLSHIRQQAEWKDIPIVVFTTSDSRESKAKSLTLGAMDYIVKPNDYHGLMDITSKMMQYCSR